MRTVTKFASLSGIFLCLNRVDHLLFPGTLWSIYHRAQAFVTDLFSWALVVVADGCSFVSWCVYLSEIACQSVEVRPLIERPFPTDIPGVDHCKNLTDSPQSRLNAESLNSWIFTTIFRRSACARNGDHLFFRQPFRRRGLVSFQRHTPTVWSLYIDWKFLVPLLDSI